MTTAILAVGAILVGLALGTIALASFCLWRMNRAIANDTRDPQEE